MTMDGPVRQAPLVLQLSGRFRRLIAAGDWPVGSRIPAESSLAEELGVSRGTVREALRALSLTGLLEPRVGDGTYVRARDELAGLLVRDDVVTGLDHVLDARAGLELAAARLAALRGHGHDDLPAALAARDAADDARDRDAYLRADAAFHRAVVVASGNPVLLRLYDAVSETVTRSIEATTALPEAAAVTRAHHALVDAVRAGAPDAAAAASYALIEAVRSAS